MMTRNLSILAITIITIALSALPASALPFSTKEFDSPSEMASALRGTGDPRAWNVSVPMARQLIFDGVKAYFPCADLESPGGVPDYIENLSVVTSPSGLFDLAGIREKDKSMRLDAMSRGISSGFKDRNLGEIVLDPECGNPAKKRGATCPPAKVAPAIGPQGPAGDPGEQGPKGDQGPAGRDGRDGAVVAVPCDRAFKKFNQHGPGFCDGGHNRVRFRSAQELADHWVNYHPEFCQERPVRVAPPPRRQARCCPPPQVTSARGPAPPPRRRGGGFWRSVGREFMHETLVLGFDAVRDNNEIPRRSVRAYGRRR